MPTLLSEGLYERMLRVVRWGESQMGAEVHDPQPPPAASPCWVKTTSGTATNGWYPAHVIEKNGTEDTWEEGTVLVRVQGANGEALANAVRYGCRPSGPNDAGEETYTTLSSPGGTAITIEEDDGVPSYTASRFAVDTTRGLRMGTTFPGNVPMITAAVATTSLVGVWGGGDVNTAGFWGTSGGVALAKISARTRDILFFTAAGGSSGDGTNPTNANGYIDCNANGMEFHSAGGSTLALSVSGLYINGSAGVTGTGGGGDTFTGGLCTGLGTGAAVTPEQVQDISGPMMRDGTHPDMTVTYDDTGGVVNLATLGFTGTITGSLIRSLTLSNGLVKSGVTSLVQTADIQDGAVTYAKVQNVTAARLLGRGSAAGPGAPVEVTPALSVALSGTSLQLLGDAASPGASKLYGTDSAGTRGWYAQPTATNEGVWRFDNTSTAMSDPGAGKLRFNNALASSVTALAISATSDTGAAVANFLRGLKSGDTIYVQEKADSSHWARFALTATPLDNTSWFQLPVSYVGASGVAPTNNSQLAVVFTTAAGGAAAGRTSVTPAAIQQTAAGDATLIAAPGAGLRVKLIRVEASNSHATAAALVGLKVASMLSGAAFAKRWLPAAGGAGVWQWDNGQLLLGLNEALLVNLSVASQIEWTAYFEVG